MGRHIIVTSEAGRRVRLVGVFTDEQFFALPLVKQFGCFPAGYAACHFGDEDGLGSEHYLAIPESSRKAVDVLRDLLKAARAHAYAVVRNGEPVSYHSSQAAALKAMRDLVYYWRRGGSHKHQQTALNVSGTRGTPENAVGRAGFDLRRRAGGHTSAVAFVYVKPTCTGAVAFQDAVDGRVEAVAS